MKSYKELSEEYTQLNLDIVANEKWLKEHSEPQMVDVPARKLGRDVDVLGLLLPILVVLLVLEVVFIIVQKIFNF